MAEVMNRAARRAAGKKKGTVSVRNRIAVVPMEHIETYFTHEIASEGQWASNRDLIILRPSVDAGRADSDWFPKTLERMRETRRRQGPLPIPIAIAEGREIEIDVGLVDVTVHFEMPSGIPPLPPTTRAELDSTLTENLRHFDAVCAGALHDQMIMATAPHFFRSNGSRLLHFHNLIFGLRQEVRRDLDILGPLDIDPLLKALIKSGPLSVIGGMKP